jgi:hypothetical protein
MSNSSILSDGCVGEDSVRALSEEVEMVKNNK